MGRQEVIDTGKRYGLNTAHLQIFNCIVKWFNGHRFTIHDRPVSIRTVHEPTLRQLCSAADVWGDDHNQAHDAMIEQGWFKSEAREEKVHLCGRRCNWLPTKAGMAVIEDVFETYTPVYPKWILDEHTGPPTFRDGSRELMTHRKGVLVAAHALGRMEWVIETDLYPQVNLPQRPDVRIFGHEQGPLARVEVLTEHGNRETWETKFEAWQHPKTGPTIWVFENRTTMVHFFNHLVRHGYLELDGGLFKGKPKNWSPERVNDRLKRSREGAPDYDSTDVVWTIGGLLQADRVDVHEWTKRYNIQ